MRAQSLLIPMLCAMLMIAADVPARDDRSPEEPIDVVARLKGGEVTQFALGVRIGKDALREFGANPRNVDVALLSGRDAPCGCLLGGVFFAVNAGPQSGLRARAGDAAADQFAVVIVRHPNGQGQTLRYVIPDDVRRQLLDWEKQLDAAGRYRAVMDAPAESLFRREVAAAATR